MMDKLAKISRKKRKLIVGLMSGTSADGIDAALVEVHGSGHKTKLRLFEFKTYPYPRGFKEFLLRNSNAVTARLDDVTRLDILIGIFFAEAAKKIVRQAGFRIGEIDLIGSHGQTIHHLPSLTEMFGVKVRATMQIGNPAVIAKHAGVITVGDFRAADVAVGGTGAPLVPLFDFLTLHSTTVTRAALNIGGIANITVLPENCSIHQVLAFDTGPGNMVIDRIVQELFDKSFDRHGAIASGGKLISPLLHWMANHPYLRQRPPKSTGREMFGEEFVKQVLLKARRQPKEDIVATVSEFTALCVYQSYLRFIGPRVKIDELLVSGGGVHNRYLMNALRRYFDGATVRSTDDAQLQPDAKEAICFALLANETISGNPGNVPRATGASRQTILGSISLPG